MTAIALATKKSESKQFKAQKPESSYKRPHAIVPIEDMLWASQQSGSVAQLWQEAWIADPYGSRWMVLNHTLGYSTFIAAKKILTERGLFVFKPEKSIRDGRETSYWKVLNLHGSRVKDFWNQEADSAQTESCTGVTELDSGNSEIDAKNLESISSQTQPEQAFQNLSRTFQEQLTNSSKEIVSCSSSSQTAVITVEETATESLGDSLPSSTQRDEEGKEQVADYPERLNRDKEPVSVKLLNYLEDKSSAPPPAFLRTKQLLTARKKLQDDRKSKLRLACNIGDCPGFDFLYECWEDGDRILRQSVRKALERYPHWAEITDEGELVEVNVAPWDKIAQQMEQIEKM